MGHKYSCSRHHDRSDTAVPHPADEKVPAHIRPALSNFMPHIERTYSSLQVSAQESGWEEALCQELRWPSTRPLIRRLRHRVGQLQKSGDDIGLAGLSNVCYRLLHGTPKEPSGRTREALMWFACGLEHTHKAHSHSDDINFEAFVDSLVSLYVDIGVVRGPARMNTPSRTGSLPLHEMAPSNTASGVFLPASNTAPGLNRSPRRGSGSFIASAPAHQFAGMQQVEDEEQEQEEENMGDETENADASGLTAYSLRRALLEVLISVTNVQTMEAVPLKTAVEAIERRLHGMTVWLQLVCAAACFGRHSPAVTRAMAFVKPAMHSTSELMNQGDLACLALAMPQVSRAESTRRSDSDAGSKHAVDVGIIDSRAHAEHDLEGVPGTYLLFSTNVHGKSLRAFTHAVLGYPGATLLIIRTDQGQIIGAYNSLSWRDSTVYSRNEDTFLFTLRPFLRILPWSGFKHNFRYFNTIDDNHVKGIGFGGSNPHFRFFIDESLNAGRTMDSDATFVTGSLLHQHPRPGENSDFYVDTLEVWGLGGSEAMSGLQDYQQTTEMLAEKARKYPYQPSGSNYGFQQMAGLVDEQSRQAEDVQQVQQQGQSQQQYETAGQTGSSSMSSAESPERR